jgi:hypothetical protein
MAAARELPTDLVQKGSNHLCRMLTKTYPGMSVMPASDMRSAGLAAPAAAVRFFRLALWLSRNLARGSCG